MILREKFIKFAADRMEMKQHKEQILKKIRELGARILPSTARLLLYGSQARGDSNEDSDWDMLIILDKEDADYEDFNQYAYPLYMLGAEMQEIFSLIVYGSKQWAQMTSTPFFHNVQRDKIELL